MLKQLRIRNFRCYEDCTIHFNGTSVLVGKNNAGKSTLIEALKIISSVTRKYKALRFTAPPEWIEDCLEYGVSPNVENMNISDRGIFNMYGNPPAIIEAIFNNNTSIKAYVGEWLTVFAVIYDEDGYAARNNKEVKSINIPLIEVLPQISAVLDSEKVIKKATVDGNRATRLASRNFRNQLYYYREAFPVFKNLVESTWERLRVSQVESIYENDGQLLQLFIRVNNFEAEIGWMGHGLQMWIQTMWFISQCSNDSIVVLDEPDVYMHADLQRRLMRLITPMFPQLIVATHSLEIIEEVTSDCIIPIDSCKREVQPIGDNFSMNYLCKLLGSAFNIDLARVFISKLFVFWDGDDNSRKILSAFQTQLFPQDLYPLINLPKAYIKGSEDLDNVMNISEVFLKNRMDIKFLCILNSRNNEKEINQRISLYSKSRHVKVHVWNKYEIENYTIQPDVILRYIERFKKKGKITKKLLVCEMEKIACKICKEELKVKPSLPKLIDSISGKTFIENLSKWTLEEFGVSITARQLVPHFQMNEIPEEIKDLIGNIMDTQKN